MPPDADSGGFISRFALDVVRDHPYGPDPSQSVDVYRKRGLRDAGVIIFVHGGAWALGDKANPGVVRGKVARWVPMGCLFVSVNYRLLPAAGPLEQTEDLAQAMANVQLHLARWGGDERRVALIGHSTGAHLAALLHADANLRDRHGVMPWAGTVLLDTAALDVEKIMSMPHRPLYDRVFGIEPDFWRQVSPWHRLEGPTPPMQVVCGTGRESASEDAERYASKARELGGVAEVLHLDLAHAEFNRLLGIDPRLTSGVEGFLDRVGVLT
jgi:acetyl esterase/lipase